MYLMEKMALEAVLYLNDYCDRTPLCSDCVLHGSNGCMLVQLTSDITLEECNKLLKEGDPE